MMEITTKSSINVNPVRNLPFTRPLTLSGVLVSNGVKAFRLRMSEYLVNWLSEKCLK